VNPSAPAPATDPLSPPSSVCIGSMMAGQKGRTGERGVARQKLMERNLWKLYNCQHGHAHIAHTHTRKYLYIHTHRCIIDKRGWCPKGLKRRWCRLTPKNFIMSSEKNGEAEDASIFCLLCQKKLYMKKVWVKKETEQKERRKWR